MSHPEMIVLPPDSLIFRVAGDHGRDHYLTSGARSVQNLSAALGLDGKTLLDFPRILDWGCGCGRILRHLEKVGEKCDLRGVDIDADAIAWSSSHIPWARCTVSGGLPPLEFPDGFFDLVFNHSVLSHLDETYQDAWLRELRRVVRPGGTVILTVLGDAPFEQLEKEWTGDGGGEDVAAGSAATRRLERFLGVARYRRLRRFWWSLRRGGPAVNRGRLRAQRLRRERDTKGIVHIREDSWVGGPFPDFYHSTFHAPWYVLEHWKEFFEIRAYIVRGALDYQDMVVLRRPTAP